MVSAVKVVVAGALKEAVPAVRLAGTVRSATLEFGMPEVVADHNSARMVARCAVFRLPPMTNSMLVSV